MSRRECKRGQNCGDECCPLDDKAGVIDSCDEFEASGWTAPMPRSPEIVAAKLAEKEARFRDLKTGAGGFGFGQGRIAQKEAQRRRREISALRRELESWQ